MFPVNATHHDSSDCRRRVGPLRLSLKSHCAAARWDSRKILCRPVTCAIQLLAFCLQQQEPHSTASPGILIQDSLVCGDGQTFWNNVPSIQSNQHSLPSFLMSCLPRNTSLCISFNCPWAGRRAKETIANPKSVGRAALLMKSSERSYIPSCLTFDARSFDAFVDEAWLLAPHPSRGMRAPSVEAPPTEWWWCLRRAKWKDAPSPSQATTSGFAVCILIGAWVEDRTDGILPRISTTASSCSSMRVSVLSKKRGPGFVKTLWNSLVPWTSKSQAPLRVTRTLWTLADTSLLCSESRCMHSVQTCAELELWVRSDHCSWKIFWISSLRVVSKAHESRECWSRHRIQ